jgi:HK97 gp10 family phage protein
MKRNKNHNRDVTQKAIFQLGKIESTTRENLLNAAEKGAQILVIEAKRRAPERTGRLRESIDKRQYDKEKDGASYLVYSSAFYADAVEKGPNKRPFMRPAFDSMRGRIADEMRGEFIRLDKIKYIR